MDANGFVLMISSSAYGGRKLPESSRLIPRQVWVRSFVPKLKNCAVCAISSVTSPHGAEQTLRVNGTNG